MQVCWLRFLLSFLSWLIKLQLTNHKQDKKKKVAVVTQIIGAGLNVSIFCDLTKHTEPITSNEDVMPGHDGDSYDLHAELASGEQDGEERALWDVR